MKQKIKIFYRLQKENLWYFLEVMFKNKGKCAEHPHLLEYDAVSLDE